MKIGYARVSTTGQDNAVQVAALNAAGCARIFEEQASGGSSDRPQLIELMRGLSAGDVLVVWKLDRLTRSLRDLLGLLETLQGVGVGFQSVTESIDTTSAAGRMMMHMIGAFAEFERAMLRERTLAGLENARAQGRVGGRRHKLTPRQRAEVVRMVNAGEKTAADAARLFNVSPATISRLLARGRG